VLLDKKKGSKMRLCVYYRQLNKVMIKNKYSMKVRKTQEGRGGGG